MSNEVQTTTDPQENVHCFTPRVDIWETETALHLTAEMPGVSADRVDVHLEDGTLTILGRVEPENFGECVHSEYRVGNFERAFRISEKIESQAIEASMRDGVLAVTLPKAEAAKPRQIAVQAG